MLGKTEGRRRRGHRGWDGWMASATQRTRVWASSGSRWWTGKPGVLQSMGSQRVRHDWATELNWWMCWVFIATRGLSLVWGSGDSSLVVVCGLLIAVTSRRRAWAECPWDSAVVAPGLQRTNSIWPSKYSIAYIYHTLSIHLSTGV